MTGSRPSLRAVEPVREDSSGPDVVFCSHCAAHDSEVQSRICRACGMGVMLTAASLAAPTPGDAFMVVDGSLNVGGVSEAAAAWLGRDEEHLVHRPVVDFFEPAEVTKSAPRTIAGLLHTSTDAPREVMVRPTGMFGVHVRARIARCRPAGLLVVLLVPNRR